MYSVLCDSLHVVFHALAAGALLQQFSDFCIPPPYFPVLMAILSTPLDLLPRKLLFFVYCSNWLFKCIFDDAFNNDVFFIAIKLNDHFKPLKLNFANHQYIGSYMGIFYGTSKQQDEGNDTQRRKYPALPTRLIEAITWQKRDTLICREMRALASI